MKLPYWIWPIVAGILGFIITKLWNKLVAEHLRYSFDVRRRLRDLEEAADARRRLRDLGEAADVRRRLRDLGDAAHRLQEMKYELLHMDAPLSTSESISSWIQKVQDLQHEVRRINIRIGYHSSGLYDSASAAYLLGTKLVEELKKANDLAAQGKYFLKEARARAKRMRSSSSRYMMPLLQRHRSESRHLWGMGAYADQVHDFVGSRYGSHLLIWGMRGVGKSALLRAVRDFYAAGAGSASFEHVLFVGAGNGCTVTNVQNALATSLGLDSDWPMMSLMFRGRAIFNYLKDKNDSILLLLDDVEEPFDFKRMLPPWRNKVIMAARSQAVRAAMLHSADTTIQIRCLEQDDAWDLFKDKVGLGIIDAHPQVHRLAKQMVAECRGLPLSLCVIGRAMSSKTDAREWRNAYNLLKAKHSKTQEDEGYSCLDILEAQLKDSFLVTSLWPKDGSIPREGRDAPRDHILTEGELNVDAEKVDMPDHLERLSDESAGSESDNHKEAAKDLEGLSHTLTIGALREHFK